MPSVDEENPSFDDPSKVARQNSGITAFRSYEEGEEFHTPAQSASSGYVEETGVGKPLQIDSPPEEDKPSGISCLNVLNFLAYLLNAGTVYVVGLTNYFDLPTNAEISGKYQSLVTPAGFTFSIWAVIFIFQFFWAFFQLLPAYSASDLVLKGVGCQYIFACIAQIAWTGLFAIEEIPYSMIAMICIFIPLFIVLCRLPKYPSENIFSYFILKFPFEIHAAWIIIATLVNANVVLVAMEISSDNQIIGAGATLSLLAIFGFSFISRKQWVVPLVIVWGCLGIAFELMNPQNIAVVENFEGKVIMATEFAAGGLAAVLLISIIIKLFLISKDDKNVEEEDEDDAYVKM